MMMISDPSIGVVDYVYSLNMWCAVYQNNGYRQYRLDREMEDNALVNDNWRPCGKLDVAQE